jgi:hypothetical protein
MPSLSSYPDWKAPGQDSELLIWPDPAQLLNNTLEVHRSLSEVRQRIGGIELSELRRRQREQLKLDDARPAIGTGHQAELYHSGVWAKLALLHAAGPRIDASCLHLAVDTDGPKHLNLRWPLWSQPITDDPQLTTAPWSGLLQAPTSKYVNDLKSMLMEAARAWPFMPMAAEVLDDLNRQSPQRPALPVALTQATHRLDLQLGLRHQAVVASPLWQSEPYLVLAHDILSRAPEFAAIYNAALREYRAFNRIRTDGRPMPDLTVSHDTCEAPYWLDDLGAHSRARCRVVRRGDAWSLVVGGDEFALGAGGDGWAAAADLKQFLIRHNARLSPRALTLTLFMRLLIVDQFVHGVGGARYDQVTDQVIQRFIGIAPPSFSVTTTTLYFPTAVGRPRACLPCLAHEGHRLRHRAMGEAKLAMVRQIEQLPRGSADRQQLFSEMHNRLSAAVQAHPAVRSWERRRDEAARSETQDQPLFDREFFYAMQPRDRLNAVIEQYQARFSAGGR